MDAKVPEHGVRFPMAEEHDGVAVDIGAEEGSAPPGRRERADTFL